MKFKTLSITCCSITIELVNSEVYFANENYDVIVDDKVILHDENRNVFTLFDLEPGHEYKITIGEDTQFIKTENASYILHVKDFLNDKEDQTLAIQTAINLTPKHGLLIIDEGIYHITSLFVKDNITINLKRGAVLLGNTKLEDYANIVPEVKSEDKERLPLELATWEGNPFVGKTSLINGFENVGFNIVGEGTIDAQAQDSPFWIDVKHLTYSRPRVFFLNQCEHFSLIGITIKNSPCWTIHPYFSKHFDLLNLNVINPKDAPNTDGLDPESCTDFRVIGVYFSVGDDCIALKSGKIYIGSTFKTPCQKVEIRNCYMNEGHGAVILGSEAGAGVKDITVERCYFKHTDRGLRIKTRRGRGVDSFIDNIVFKDIVMDNVLTPLVINMFYFCDPDGKCFEVQDKNPHKVDETTPYLGSFTFENIKSTNSEWALGFFYGLPEQKIKSITIRNSSFTVKEGECSKGFPAMMCDIDKYSKAGFIFHNVDTILIDNVKIGGVEGDIYTTENIGEFREL